LRYPFLTLTVNQESGFTGKGKRQSSVRYST
jgi:hypothetical protein